MAGNRTPTTDKARDRVDRLADPEGADEVLGAVDTTRPLEARGNGAAMVPAQDGQARDLAADVDRGVKLARNAEHQRYAAALLAEATQVGDLIALLIEVGDHHAARELAPAGLRKRVADAAHAFTEGGEAS